MSRKLIVTKEAEADILDGSPVILRFSSRMVKPQSRLLADPVAVGPTFPPHHHSKRHNVRTVGNTRIAIRLR